MFLLFITSISYSPTNDDEEDQFIWGDISKELEGKPINWGDVERYDVVVIGSGPAGSTSAIYSARANLNTAVFHGHLPGGQLTKTTEVENFPTFTGTGPELVKKIQSQAMKYGALYLAESVAKVDFSVKPFRIETDIHRGYLATSIIIATGANPRYLGLRSEERFMNRGLSVCAACDGALFAKQDVAVVGGGDVAVHEALYLANLCRNVKLFVRRSSLRASEALRAQIIKSDVEVFYNTEVRDLIGGAYLTAIDTKNSLSGDSKRFSVSALFLAIGQTPATKIFEGLLKLDSDGYIDTNGTYMTNIPGVFAAGDCANKNYRQAVAAAGTGCMAALLAEKYVMAERAK